MKLTDQFKIGDRKVQTIDEAREAIEAAGTTVRIVFDRGLQSVIVITSLLQFFKFIKLKTKNTFAKARKSEY